MNVLVTGATGFVMASLVRHLAGEGHAVVAADLNPPDDRLAAFWRGLPGPVTRNRFTIKRKGKYIAVMRKGDSLGSVR